MRKMEEAARKAAEAEAKAKKEAEEAAARKAAEEKAKAEMCEHHPRRRRLRALRIA